MLNLFRRHVRKCPNDTRDSLRCQCPIWMDWVQGNVRLHRSLGVRDWQAAQRRARDMEANGIEKYVGGDHEALTIQKATEDFQADAKHHIKDATLKQYRVLLDRLNEYCRQHGYIFLRQLGVVQVREFRNSWTTYCDRTAVKHTERLKRFFSFCVENRWLDESPARPLKSASLPPSDVAPFPESDVDKILKACEAYSGSNREKLIVLTDLMLTAGLSIGDATMLSKTKVVKNNSGWHLELHRTKTNAAVSCPIPDDLAEAFLKLDGDTPFWSGKSDLETLTKNWRKIYGRIFKRAGIVDGHPHRFRHTCAKRLLVKGVPAGFVASILGDSEEIVRKHYSKWISERQDAVDAAVRAAWKR